MTQPSLKVQLQGVTTASADNLNTYGQTCASVAQLRAFIGLPNMLVYLQGLSTPDDGGEGDFLWWATVSEADDGENYIIPPGANGGGWIRQGPNLVLPAPQITGMLSAVTDANAKAVLTSIIAALVVLGLVTSGTT